MRPKQILRPRGTLLTLYASCRYHDGHLWVIDVSQSIEHEHPAAFDFLRADIQNADDFFARRGVKTLGLRRTFNFVTGDRLVSDREETDDDVAEAVRRLLAEEPAPRPGAGEQADDSAAAKRQSPSASDEAVFAQSYIPRTLDQVYDVERDVERVIRGEGSDLIYADLTGVAGVQKAQEVRTDEANAGDADGAAAPKEKLAGDGEKDEASDADGDSAEDDSASDADSDGVRRPRGKRFEDKDEKKVSASAHIASLSAVS